MTFELLRSGLLSTEGQDYPHADKLKHPELALLPDRPLLQLTASQAGLYEDASTACLHALNAYLA